MTTTGPEGSAPQKPPRKTGFSHLIAAATYSVAGLRRLLRESAFRQELTLGLLILIGLAAWGLSPGRIIGFAILLLILVMVEALNTAIEVLVDHLSPGWSEFARDAKDLGSLAVGATLCAMGLYLGWALFL
ncbi:diacylglycerol kinase [Xinfangfangia sp. D13-10-4-6]|uniref:diacylglycerol kinase n=1 Tax=Pseudogemmobacter hezensis TaxID=2737662 RepID=UPI00155503DD|nr:diacylglycerol kinase [Pseudogemmobacter hezensis]NPD17115.1 diacylglycerol kinase [Pseudogemmobacter hezensis]